MVKPVQDKPVSEPKADEPVSEPKADDQQVQQAGTDQYGRQLYTVTCAGCGKPAQVPFKPAQDRPVYCRDCYMQQRRSRQDSRR